MKTNEKLSDFVTARLAENVSRLRILSHALLQDEETAAWQGMGLLVQDVTENLTRLLRLSDEIGSRGNVQIEYDQEGADTVGQVLEQLERPGKEKAKRKKAKKGSS